MGTFLCILSRAVLVVKVYSINTNVGKRDTHLRSDDFFGTAKYPEIRFTSSKVTHAGGNKYLVNGQLTIKDVSKDLTLEFIYWGEKENPLKPGEMVAGLDARQTLDRLAYHIGDGKFYKIATCAVALLFWFTVGVGVGIAIAIDIGSSTLIAIDCDALWPRPSALLCLPFSLCVFSIPTPIPIPTPSTFHLRYWLPAQVVKLERWARTSIS